MTLAGATSRRDGLIYSERIEGPQNGDPKEDGVPSFAIFNLLQDGILLQGPLINRIEPLMVTLSKFGYSVSVFEARVGSGRLFATGLNLLSGSPEGSYLLDQFVTYTRSHDFAPRKKMAISELKNAMKQTAAADAFETSSREGIA